MSYEVDTINFVRVNRTCKFVRVNSGKAREQCTRAMHGGNARGQGTGTRRGKAGTRRGKLGRASCGKMRARRGKAGQVTGNRDCV